MAKSVSRRLFTQVWLALALAMLSADAFPTARLDAAEEPIPYDAEEQIQRLDSLLSSRPDRYQLIIVDPFEGVRQWKSRGASSALDDVRYVRKTAAGRAFRMEQDMVHGWAKTDVEFEQSLLLHTQFPVPGEQSYLLLPSEEIRVPGLPERLFVWIHSQNYRHRLVFIFRNADDREVRVPMPPLYWHGWRRLQVDLPAALKRQGRRAGRQFESRLTGILVESNKLGGDGEVAILLDNLTILSDIRGLQYPGAEMPDTWK